MRSKYYLIIKKEFDLKKRDYEDLFMTVSRVAEKIGTKKAYAYLEECVIDKKLDWLKKNKKLIKKEKNVINNALNIFYKKYLGIKFGCDGKIIKKTERILITRSYNDCPVLDACRKCNLETKIICKQIYHKWAQIFLKEIDPKLKFIRNYNNIRPYKAYCEETIKLIK